MPKPPSLLTAYRPPAGHYDELLDSDRRIREHWQSFFAHLDASSTEQIHARQAFAAQRIQENGITYNVYADAQGASRPWELDLLPLIIPAAEWRQISAGICQRAALLDAVLADVYGEQKLIREGLLPPSLVYGHQDFLWPALGVKPPGNVFLHVYAADLARSPDGRWWVIADRTQAPSGAGYALENRLIVSRVFGEQFRDSNVVHLASFFRARQEGLAHLAPLDGSEAPFVVLLSPGPYNETYFEHVYLARYLGFPLVEGQDLTVREDTVYLKTLTGLKRVHVILRRMDDSWCDPLELRSDSTLGVPGLLQAVRAGRVAVANALGSGVAESAALPGFLPGICQALRGEELAIPSVATWWCGEGPALEHTLANLERMVIKGAFPSQRFDPVFGESLSAAERESLITRIRARPRTYVAQELVELSQAPTWSPNHARRLQPRAVGLRVFAVWTPEGYVAMPGGLARVAGAEGARVVTMQRGGKAKDAWILADEPVSTFSMLKRTVTVQDLARHDERLPSRTVENLYWMGRYSERCDNIARLSRVILGRLTDNAEDPALGHALAVAGFLGFLPYLNDTAEADIEGSLLAALIGDSWAGSLATNLQRVQWTATQVRERLSGDNWHGIQALARELAAVRTGKGGLGDMLAFLDHAVLAFTTLAGFAMDNMTQDTGWRFLMVGRRLERLGFLAQALGHYLSLQPAPSPEGLEWLLELTDSVITYRGRYLARPQLLPLVDLVVFDETNPHAVAFQVRAIIDCLAAEPVAGDAGDAMADPAAELAAFDPARLEPGPAQVDASLDLASILQRLAIGACNVSERLNLRCFTHMDETSQQAA